ncbi:MAG: efflux RND transporter periplasmic adaptor subunit [Planctomycetota bacterium]
MKPTRALLTALGLFAAVVGSAGCREKPPEKTEVPVPVVAETAGVRAVRDMVETVGHVEPQVRSRVGSVLPGRIVRMTRDVGDVVFAPTDDQKGGERGLLARLDTRLLEANAERLRAEIERAAAQKADAERKYRNFEELYQKNATSKENRDQAKAAFDMARAEYETARAAYREVQVKIAQSSIYAPANATVIEKLAHEGDVVNPGQPVSLLECIGDLKINAIVPERDVVAVRKGKPVEIRFDGLPGRTFAATIHTVVPSGDPLARSFIAQIRFRNYTREGVLGETLPEDFDCSDLLIKPGMFARIEIVKYEKEDALVVPDRCVVEQGERRFVYRIDGRTAHKEEVETGVVSGGVTEIRAGLERGQRVVGRGIENVTEGQAVRVIEGEAPAPESVRPPPVTSKAAG